MVLNSGYPLKFLDIKKKNQGPGLILGDFLIGLKWFLGSVVLFVGWFFDSSPQVILMCSQDGEALVFSNFFVFLVGRLELR